MFGKPLLRSPSNQNKSKVFLKSLPSVRATKLLLQKLKATQNFSSVLNLQGDEGMKESYASVQTPTSINARKNIQTSGFQKASKSSEKYVQNANSSNLKGQTKPVRYESIQSKIQNKRRHQGLQLQLKENVYSPTKIQQSVEQQFSQTANFRGIKERHLDLGSTQNLNRSNLNNNNTIKSSEKQKANNFDFSLALRMPISTKNGAARGQLNKQELNNTCNTSFQPNNNLQSFINMSQQPKQKPNHTVVEKSSSSKRKSSNQVSKKQLMPVLDTKKMSMRQIQNLIKNKVTSVKDKYEHGTRQNEIHQQINHLGDSALYKNLTQKLIKEQQQQKVTKTISNAPSNSNSRFNLLKKQQMSSPSKRDSSKPPATTSNIEKVRHHPHRPDAASIPMSTTNNNKKSFNFDLGQYTKNSLAANQKKNNSQIRAVGKKALNLTGTLPKGLLSPTNNNTAKHKHAQYFESASTVAYNQFEHTMPLKFADKNFPLRNNRNKGTPANRALGNTVININIENGRCNHSHNQGYCQQTKGHQSMCPQFSQAPQSQEKEKANFNRTIKIKRNESISSSRSSINGRGKKRDLNSSNNQTNTKKTPIHHQKNSTLPNAAVLLLNEILQGGGEIRTSKVNSTKQTPKAEHPQPNRSKKIQNKSEVVSARRKGSEVSVNNISLRQPDQVVVQPKPSRDSIYFKDIEVGLDQESQKNKTQQLSVMLKGKYAEPLVIDTSNQKLDQTTNDLSRKLSQINQQKQELKIPVSISPKHKESEHQQLYKVPQTTKQSQVQPAISQVQAKKSEAQIYQEIKFPMTTAKALKLFMSTLTDYEKGEILDYKQVYFLGTKAEKIKASPLHAYNYGYDDERGDYKVVLKDQIAYRYEVLDFLGKGSFGQALKCFDHKTGETVALKVIRNKKRFQHQAGVELKLLLHLKERDPDDAYNIIRIKDYVLFRKHLVLSFELFSINLYEFIKNNNFQGVSLSLIRRFSIQILQSLKYLKDEKVIHCDLKPENILLKSPDKSGIKIIDFGSSCFNEERIYTYIQSRFYRAPEIILGIPYTQAIDMWSFGCILIELYTGFPIFPGESEMEQLSLIMEVLGEPPEHVLEQSTRKKMFFDPETDEPILTKNSRGRMRIPGTKSLSNIARCQNQNFLDFLERCLDWDPQTRITPFEALQHDWVIEGLPPKVLLHHRRMLGIPSDQQFQTSPSLSSGSSSSNSQLQRPPRQQRSLPRSQHQKKPLNSTCVLSEDVEEQDIKKRVKSLNKTGLVIIDDQEDIVDGIAENPPIFFGNKLQEQEKSKTTNMAELFQEMNKKKSKKQMFGNTQDIGKLNKKTSFLSQNNIEEGFYEDIEGEEDVDGDMLPFDERSQHQGDEKTKAKKNKMPFSFLMHHYLKTSGGQHQKNQSHQQIGFFKPRLDVKMNNFIDNLGSSNHSTKNAYYNKALINQSSNI